MRIPTILRGVLALPCCLFAQSVSLPPVDLAASSFRDGVGGPGLLLQERIQDSDAQHSHSRLYMQQVSYTTTLKVLGGYYGFELLQPVVSLYSVPQIRAGKTAFGDLIISPFVIQWVDQRLFGKPYFHRFNVGLTLPTGQYSRSSTVNIGNNVVGVDPYYAFTLFVTPKLETSFRLHYLWNSRNNDPPFVFKANSIQPGQAFHFNFGTSYEIIRNFRLGVAGYYLQQTTLNRIDGRIIPNSSGEGISIGPGVQYSVRNWTLTFTAHVETWVENRPHTQRFTIIIKKTFPSVQRAEPSARMGGGGGRFLA
jgi:hypothetical protein